MPPKSPPPGQTELFRSALVNLIDRRHPLVRLAGLIDWEGFGTIVSHIEPEAAVGGPLQFVDTGDRIRLSVKNSRLDLLVDEATLARRRAAWTPAPAPARGRDRLVCEQVTRARLGADLAFLCAAP